MFFEARLAFDARGMRNPQAVGRLSHACGDPLTVRKLLVAAWSQPCQDDRCLMTVGTIYSSINGQRFATCLLMLESWTALKGTQQFELCTVHRRHGVKHSYAQPIRGFVQTSGTSVSQGIMTSGSNDHVIFSDFFNSLP